MRSTTPSRPLPSLGPDRTTWTVCGVIIAALLGYVVLNQCFPVPTFLVREDQQRAVTALVLDAGIMDFQHVSRVTEDRCPNMGPGGSMTVYEVLVHGNQVRAVVCADRHGNAQILYRHSADR